MLHRAAEVQRGETIVVSAPTGGVGSMLVQLARHAGIRVIGTAGPAQQEHLRALGATPIDHRAEDVPARVRELAPGGVAAVFDHVGGPGIDDSWQMSPRRHARLLRHRGRPRDVPGNPRRAGAEAVAKLQVWNPLPNGRKATFFNLWAGQRLPPRALSAQLREDLTQSSTRSATARSRRRSRATLPARRDAAAALRYAEAGGFTGKVVLLP